MITETLMDEINSKLVSVTHAIYTALFILIMYSAKIDIVKFICKYSLAISIIVIILFIYEFILYKISDKKIKASDAPATVDELIKQTFNSNGKPIKVDLNVNMYSELHDQATINMLKLVLIVASALVIFTLKVQAINFSRLFIEIAGWFTLIVFVYLVFSTINSVLSSTILFIKCKNTVVKAEYIGKAKKISDKEKDKKDEKDEK
ncbi:MAG: hypothetical protein [Caudoviricetes sp.]|nr:MAG: hypothetical protein [Caudoviricetes sp.]